MLQKTSSVFVVYRHKTLTGSPDPTHANGMDKPCNTLSRACRMVNDKVHRRKPIRSHLLEQLLFETERAFSNQYYLEIMYKTVFLLSYYGLLQIGEVTMSPHVLKARKVEIGQNKDKIWLILFTSKTHGLESKPQQIRILGDDAPSIENRINSRKRFFCPFRTTRKYLAMRGDYVDENEQFFIFRDRSPVQLDHVRKVLKLLIQKLNLDPSKFGCHSFRIGRCSELIKLGYSIEAVKRLGRWRSNAVYRYIKD